MQESRRAKFAAGVTVASRSYRSCCSVTVASTVATPGVNPLTKVSDHSGFAAYDTASMGFVHRLAGRDLAAHDLHVRAQFVDADVVTGLD